MKHARISQSFPLRQFLLSHTRCFLYVRYSSTQAAQPPTFGSIGVDEFVMHGLEKAFPHVKTPTPTQEQFIPAILGGRDVLLQDRTGTGKSFGLLLALLSKPRASRQVAPRHWKDRATQKSVLKEAITSILIVPHNDLAHQFSQWIKSMRLTTTPRQLVQTLLKDGVEHYDEQLARIAKQPPHILITTPKALDDCWKKGKQLFTLDSVSTVVLEEADSLLRIPSNNTPPEVQKRWRKHPPVVRELLADVFKHRPKHNMIRKDDSQTLSSTPPHGSVQMVLVSATLRPAVRKFLFLDTKWLSQEPGQTIQIDGTKEMDRRRDPVRHYGLFVDVSGSIRNIRDPDNEEDAQISQESMDLEEGEEGEAFEDDSELEDETSNNTPASMVDASPEALLWNGNRLASQLLDAVVSMFVFDVPECALLVIPSNMSARRTVEDLSELGVTAVNLDDYAAKPKETLHRLRVKSSKLAETGKKESNDIKEETFKGQGPIADNPIMLVGIQSAVRGIDLPLISHVFIAGVPESEIDYLHLAGRVGRMGAKSTPGVEVKKVITFLPEPNMNPLIGTKALRLAKEPQKRLERMWNMLGVKASIYDRAI